MAAGMHQIFSHRMDNTDHKALSVLTNMNVLASYC